MNKELSSNNKLSDIELDQLKGGCSTHTVTPNCDSICICGESWACTMIDTYCTCINTGNVC